jgi:hypothetical protein
MKSAYAYIMLFVENNDTNYIRLAFTKIELADAPRIQHWVF